MKPWFLIIVFLSSTGCLGFETEEYSSNARSQRFSPDGKRFAATLWHTASDGFVDHLIVEDVDGSNRSIIATNNPEPIIAWADDGKSIYYTSRGENSKQRIFKVAADGSSEPELIFEPDWAPLNEGSYLVDMIDVVGEQIVVSGTGLWKGTSFDAMTEFSRGGSPARLRPDGTAVAFANFDDQLVLVDFDDSVISTGPDVDYRDVELCWLDQTELLYTTESEIVRWDIESNETEILETLENRPSDLDCNAAAGKYIFTLSNSPTGFHVESL